MVEPLKEKYLEQFKKLHYQKTGAYLSDDSALAYFEQLVELVKTITSHVSPREIIIPNNGTDGRK